MNLIYVSLSVFIWTKTVVLNTRTRKIAMTSECPMITVTVITDVMWSS